MVWTHFKTVWKVGHDVMTGMAGENRGRSRSKVGIMGNTEKWTGKSVVECSPESAN